MNDTRVILFVGGPEDGHVVDGEEAVMKTTKLNATSKRAFEIGDRIRVGSSRMLKAIEIFDDHNFRATEEEGGLQLDTPGYFSRFGVDPKQSSKNRYKVTHVEDGLYVMSYDPED